MMRKYLEKLIEDYNDCSELIALLYKQKSEGEKVDEGTIQYHRGIENCTQENLRYLADNLGITLVWECMEHIFYGTEKIMLEYKTVSVAENDLEKLD